LLCHDFKYLLMRPPPRSLCSDSRQVYESLPWTRNAV